jgi:hypothetical protein
VTTTDPEHVPGVGGADEHVVEVVDGSPHSMPATGPV